MVGVSVLNVLAALGVTVIEVEGLVLRAFWVRPAHVGLIRAGMGAGDRAAALDYLAIKACLEDPQPRP